MAGQTAKVVAISGPPGSGKSTLAEALARHLGNMALLSMDHYQSMTQMPIDEIARWQARGAHLDELPVGPLAEHLEMLKEGHPVRNPATGAMIMPSALIVFDSHFGRAHRSTGPLIDILVWLDTPPDMALSRNLRGFLRPMLGPVTPANTRERLLWIDRYLVNYQTVVSGLLGMQADRIRPGADLLIEPNCSTDDAVQRICDRLAGGM